MFIAGTVDCLCCETLVAVSHCGFRRDAGTVLNCGDLFLSALQQRHTAALRSKASVSTRIIMPASLRAFFVYEGVVVALYLEDAAVAFAFLFGDGVHLVPGFEELAVLLR